MVVPHHISSDSQSTLIDKILKIIICTDEIIYQQFWGCEWYARH